MRSNLLAAASVSSTAATPTYYLFHGLQPQYRLVIKRLWGLGSPEETPARWKLISPAFNVDKIHAPLLLQMPEQEYLEALDYFMPLANSATPTDLYVFPNEPHQKVQPRHKLAAYERNLDWFRFWLQGYVDPDRRKAAQYDLWQAMRSHAAPGQRSAAAPAASTASAARQP
jgi:dipeptidyl aminopeptidase/acylaminoacyl peptidase